MTQNFYNLLLLIYSSREDLHVWRLLSDIMKKRQKACCPRKEPFTSIHLCISHSHAGSVLWHVFLSPCPCSYQAPYVRQALKQEHHTWHLVSWLETDKVASSYLSRKPHYFEPKASWFNFLLELIPYKYELFFIWSFLICGQGNSAPQICMWRVCIGFLCFLCRKQEIGIRCFSTWDFGGCTLFDAVPLEWGLKSLKEQRDKYGRYTLNPFSSCRNSSQTPGKTCL